MQIIRKILKEHLQNLSTSDVVLSITETGEIFVNISSGDQLKITDFNIIESGDELQTTPLIEGKFYFIKEPTDIKYYDGTKMISIRESLKNSLKDVEDVIATINNSLKSINENIATLDKKYEDSIDEIKKAIEDNKLEYNEYVQNNNLRVDDIEKALREINTVNDSQGQIIKETHESVLKNIEDIRGLNEGLTNTNEALNVLNKSVEDNAKKYESLENSLEQTNNELNATKETLNNHETVINKMEEKINRADYTAVYQIDRLVSGPLSPDLLFDAYSFESDQTLTITNIMIRTKTMKEFNIGVSLKHYTEKPDGSWNEPVELANVGLQANKYKSSNDVNLIIEGGYVTPEIIASTSDNSDLTIVINFHVTKK